MRKMLQLAAVVCAGFLTFGCDDGGGGGGGGTADVRGTWNGTGVYEQGTRITSFTLNLDQTGNAVTGTYDIQREGRHMAGTVSGSVSGGDIDMDLIPHGNAAGNVSGNVMNLNFFEPGFGGGPGRNAEVSLTR